MYVADRHSIELPHLFVDRSQFGRDEITVDFTQICAAISTLFHTYLLPSSQIKHKI